MLCFALLSVGATFAADNASDVIAIDDEISIDEPLAIEQDVSVVSANESADSSAAVITPSTVDQYISGSGKLNENVTADELVFEGTFDNLNLTVERPITITGGIFNDPNFEIYSSNVILKNFTILQDKGVSSIFVSGISETNHTENVTINDVQIGFTDDQSGASAVPIEVFYSDNFILSDSNISYTGKTNGYYVNNIIRIESSKNALIFNNEFIANLLSVPVGWAQEPAGSGNWVSSPMSEGIVVKNSEGAIFNGNNLTIYCANFSGSYDTIYAVDFSGSDSAIIAGNKIIAYGNSYIYGIILSGDDFIIRGNDIKSTGVLYSNGIDIEGPATGVVEDNNINVKAETSAYGIYSGMNGQDVSANYTGNNITGKAYNIFGFSLGDVESNVVKNYINFNGNYTTGIAARTGVLNVTENRIVLLSSEEGNESVWEGFGVDTRGILVISGNATIANNIIATSGTGVLLRGNDTNADLENNFINVVGNNDKDAYAIYADNVGDLKVLNNNVDYQGATNGTGVNNAVLISEIDGAIVSGNNFTLDLVSAYVPWIEEPAGSWNYVAYPVSEGIVVKNSDGVTFDSNNVNVTYGDISGTSDTIYAIDFKESDDAVIANNNIVADGKTYIYGIQISGEDFIIRANNISSTGVYYANGIDIEGPATGVVEDNVIDVKAETSAYGIYSGMNGQDVSANYTGNNITGKAYNIFGFSLGDVESNVKDNYINLNGNYTTGIAARTSVLNVSNNRIVLLSSEEGNESVWEGFGVDTRGIVVISGNATIADNIIATSGTGVLLSGNDTNADLENNFINVVANTDKDAYAIYADNVGDLKVLNNNVDYQGATNGTGVNNAVLISETDGVIVSGNNFTLDLVSAYVPWIEEPAGSWNYVAYPVSEGIVVMNSDGVAFDSNNVNVTYGDVVGNYDTIYVVDFKESDDAVISNNNIVADGKTYIYGIQISGEDFIIRANNISSTGVYYANGIDIEGPASGVVEDNVIDVNAETSAYGIYSGMNGQDVSANYTGNNITGKAYNIFGFSLGDVESLIEENDISLDGNYTTGIAFKGAQINIAHNNISALGSNEGNEPLWEAFGVESIGIKIANGTSTIIENQVVSSGDYPIDVRNTSASVHDNYLEGLRFFGDEGVKNAESSDVYNNTPEAINKTQTVISVSSIAGKFTVKGQLTDVNGTPIKYMVLYTFNGVTDKLQTDENGLFEITGLSDGDLEIFLDEDSTYLASNVVSIPLKYNAPEQTVVNVTVGEITDKNTNVTVDIPGATGNVSVIIDGVETVVPLVNGSAVVPVENITVGEHDVVVVYLGDDNHVAAYNVSSIFLEGFATEFANITVNGEGLIDAALVNSLGSPMANVTVTYKVDGVEYNTTTDDLGIFYINITGKSVVEMYYAGDDYFSPSNVTIKLENIAPARDTSVFVSSDFTQYACDYYEGERGGNFTFQLVDEMGNPLANKTVYIGYNGVTYNRTTDANGNASVQINLKSAGTYTFVIVFLGDKDYNASMAVHKVTINKKPITISANAKTFKATAKTKKYTVTLKTIKGASIDGKTYLAKGKKVTLKINGKTYTAKTNAKGQATFSIKITKKGKFATVISYDGDSTYKAASKQVKITIK